MFLDVTDEPTVLPKKRGQGDSLPVLVDNLCLERLLTVTDRHAVFGTLPIDLLHDGCRQLGRCTGVAVVRRWRRLRVGGSSQKESHDECTDEQKRAPCANHRICPSFSRVRGLAKLNYHTISVVIMQK